uniref:Uncharacterized protein n=1 Tax=Spumella elongata TaxID=89044 RepID=A0A7S3MG34_9STRA
MQVKIADLEKTIEYLSKEIEAAMSAVAEMQSQMKKASENREAENADYQQTVSDQRLSQMILSKALKRMKQVYAMLQAEPGAPHVQMEASKDDPGNGPARFAKYEKHAGGNRIVSMIEEVIKDSRTAEDDAIRAEQDSQVAYDNFMQDSNKAIATYGEKITNMKSSEATSKEDFSLAQSDLKAAVASLGELHDEAGTLHKSCDFITDTFEARQAARAAEMEALSEAKAILTGMK